MPPTGHVHAQADVSGLTTALDAKQPLNSNLTSIAALSTISFGRGILEVANSAAALTYLGAAAIVHAHVKGDLPSSVAYEDEANTFT